MPIEPRTSSLCTPSSLSGSQQCTKCRRQLPKTSFSHTNSPFYPSGLLPICNECATSMLAAANFSWESIDRLCQVSNIPFLPKEVDRILELAGRDNFWPTYVKVFAAKQYEKFGWKFYQEQFEALRDSGLIEDEVPLLRDGKLRELRKKWGGNYDDEDLYYLESLYQGLLLSQNVNGALQIDQAKKLCRLSYVIDQAIQSGNKDIDKYLSSYDKLIKTAEFTPKNAKNVNDFDSIGELALWLEKRGFANQFYDGATRDIIDETLKNMENWVQKLYINEGGIGEEISERIEQLKNTAADEQTYFDGSQGNYDLDAYDNEAFGSEEDPDSFSPMEDV